MAASYFALNTQVSESPEARNSAVLIGKLPEDTQVTTKDTGWSEEEKERMRQNGYGYGQGMVQLTVPPIACL
mgnify:CR=1 FL=1